ncbi:hypothetical protein GCM10018953_51740 [Streptosporangium nondiastaticum]
MTARCGEDGPATAVASAIAAAAVVAGGGATGKAVTTTDVTARRRGGPAFATIPSDLVDAMAGPHVIPLLRRKAGIQAGMCKG